MDVIDRRMMMGRVLASMAGNGLELVGQFTVTESWENDTKGNAKNIFDNYLYPIMSEYEQGSSFIAIAYGNTANSYRLVRMFSYLINYTSNDAKVYTLRMSSQGVYSTRSGAENGVSTWCSEGTIIKVYKINIAE